ncbi:membrane protein YdbS with pleckstrin-like domain [Microbacterium foliorum]|uniref:YrdB family protein n=1 Tax=Microbacterium foliorum TaxID=104336 RepID=UPI00209E2273|nr:YrdB family protein [Microbacterium foliorum]MCP1429239.1 membrane protein YdbS with pleckstrin-like domain [Microbacterium foliorum]
MPQDSASVPGVDRPNIAPLDIVRSIVLVVSVGTLALWGFATWPLPWNVILGIGAPLVVLLVWALFLSPRPLLRLHPFLRAAVELLIYIGVTIAWWLMDQPVVGIAFAVVAIGAGLVSGRRRIA